MNHSEIFFDARYIRPGIHDGISRFSANLFAALARQVDLTAIISDEAQLESLPGGTKWVKLHSPTSALEPLTSLRLRKHHPKVVFSPMQTIGSLGRNFKLVLTIHDLIYYRHPKPPENLPMLAKLLWRPFHLTFLPERILLAGSDAVVAVSATTADEIRANRLTKKSVAVVYNAPERVLGLPKRERVEKSLVYMGTFMSYKNVETLIRGAGLNPEYKLHLLSRVAPTRQTELEALAATHGAKVIFHNGVTDEEYHALLDSATALVSASLDEGFGIPLVEAMERGVPVLVSDIAIFHEVAGPAGVFFDPNSPEDFAARFATLATKPISAKRLRAQASKYNWDDSASSLLDLIRSL